MIRSRLSQTLKAAVEKLVAQQAFPADVQTVTPEIDVPKDASHGDFATNFALVASKAAKQNPRALAESLAAELRNDPEVFEKIEVAGPGFINLTLNPAWTARFVQTINTTPDFYRPHTPTRTTKSDSEASDATASDSKARDGEAQKINVEFVSVNPNGPITIGSGRGAAFGSALCNVLEAAGNTVHREYYINDGVNSEQMRLFAESVKAIVEGREVPDNGYKGDYVHEVAQHLKNVAASSPAPIVDYTVSEKYDDLGIVRPVWLNIITNFKASNANKITVKAFPESADIFFDGAHAGQLPRNLFDDFINASRARLQLPLNEAKTCNRFQVHFEDGIPDVEVNTSSFAKDQSITLTFPGSSSLDYRLKSQDLMIQRQQTDLTSFQVTFDTWFSEQSLHDSGQVQAELDHLVQIGTADTDPHRTKLITGKGGTLKEVQIEDQTTLTTGDSEASDAPASDREAKDGDAPTLWLRSTKFGDDQDRVLRRADGRLTYIASDVAYHKDKFNRPPGADKLITILGPDHHGYIGRLTAVVAAMILDDPEVQNSLPPAPEGEGPGMGVSPPLSDLEAKIYASPQERDLCQAALQVAKQRLEVQIFQIVRFLKDGKPAPMRKRDGNIYALIDLINEIGEQLRPDGTPEEKRQAGSDVARFFYLMRHHDTAMDFDLELATKQSDENPVFYVQYAYARICSILDKAKEEGFPSPNNESSRDPRSNEARSGEANSHLLTHPREKALILKICDLPHEVARTAQDYAVNRLTTYATELARTYHHFYDACRVIQPDQPELTKARLALCQATKSALAQTLNLLGISTPERM